MEGWVKEEEKEEEEAEFLAAPLSNIALSLRWRSLQRRRKKKTEKGMTATTRMAVIAMPAKAPLPRLPYPWACSFVRRSTEDERSWVDVTGMEVELSAFFAMPAGSVVTFFDTVFALLLVELNMGVVAAAT